jgi:DNA repair and recombination protein RAD52
MFTEQQIAELKKPLDRANVRSRQQGGGKVSYIEAYHAENEANRIFGFDAWDRTTELTHIGEREHDGKWRVYYRAKVRIVVRSEDGAQTIREGNGFGSGIDKDIGQAHESALKEAESDAEKRALKTFGNQFGQALYDKEQREVADAMPPAVEQMLTAIRACETVKALNEWKAANAKAANATGHGGVIAGEWETRKSSLEAVNAYRSG